MASEKKKARGSGCDCSTWWYPYHRPNCASGLGSRDLLTVCQRLLKYAEAYGQDLADNSVDTPESGHGAQDAVNHVAEDVEWARAALTTLEGTS